MNVPDVPEVRPAGAERCWADGTPNRWTGKMRRCPNPAETPIGLCNTCDTAKRYLNDQETTP